MKFSERLVKLRDYRGMTQSGLAAEAGITTRGLQNYETTERRPKGEYLSKLAKALKVPESALLSDEGFARFFANQKTSGIKAAVADDTNHYRAATKSISYIGTTVPLMSTNMFTLPFAIGQLITIGGIAAACAVLNKSKHTESILKEVYKELSRIECLTVFVNDKIESVRDEYERLAVITRQDDTDVAEYKAFIRLSRLLAVYQEYRSLLKQKSKYCSLLASEVESHSGKKTDMLQKLLNEINSIELKEREYANTIVSTGNELAATE